MRNLTLLLVLATQLCQAPRATAQADSTFRMTDCTAELFGGRKVKVDRVWQVSNGLLTYEANGSLHDLRMEVVQHIRCGGSDYLISGDTLTELSLDKIDHLVASGSLDLRELGKADAKRYYRGGVNFAVGMLTSTTLFVPVVVAVIPPATPKPKRNPNAVLYWAQPEYRKGYRSTAHKKKAAFALGGMTVGLLLTAVLFQY